MIMARKVNPQSNTGFPLNHFGAGIGPNEPIVLNREANLKEQKNQMLQNANGGVNTSGQFSPSSNPGLVKGSPNTVLLKDISPALAGEANTNFALPDKKGTFSPQNVIQGKINAQKTQALLQVPGVGNQAADQFKGDISGAGVLPTTNVAANSVNLNNPNINRASTLKPIQAGFAPQAIKTGTGNGQQRMQPSSAISNNEGTRSAQPDNPGNVDKPVDQLSTLVNNEVSFEQPSKAVPATTLNSGTMADSLLKSFIEKV